MKFSTLLFLLLFPLLVTGQEICNNAIDDDGDGLIDLNDPECLCGGVVPSLINNPSFEVYSQCPSTFSQISYASGWLQANPNTTTDYLNTCGFHLNSTLTEFDLLPFPDGQGAAGTIVASNFREYLTTCLPQTLSQGVNYELAFDISHLNLYLDGTTQLCDPGFEYPPIDITLYGKGNCSALTFYGSPLSSGWVILGSVTYDPESEWKQIKINFTAGSDINAISIGAPPITSPEYGPLGWFNCNSYFLYDNLILNKASLFGVTIGQSGSTCIGNLVLTATPTIALSPSAAYQWYKDGIAIMGATSSTYNIPAGIMDGSYVVKISDGLNCYISNPHLLQFDKPEVTIDQPVCVTDSLGVVTIVTPADFYSFDNGLTWQTSAVATLPLGVYHVKTKIGNCISIALGIEVKTQFSYLPAANCTIQPSCGTNGSITINTPGQSFTIDNGFTWSSSPVFTNLGPGTYEVGYINPAGCEAYSSSITVPYQFLAPPVCEVTQPNCDGGGSITFLTPAVAYSINSAGSWITGNVAENLEPGYYTVCLLNSAGCVSAFQTYHLEEFTPPNLTAPAYNVLQGVCDLFASVTIYNLAAEYTFDNGSTWQTEQTASLSSGIYQLRYKDGNGCISPYVTIEVEQNDIIPTPEFQVVQPMCDSSGSITIITPASQYSFDGGDTWQPDATLNNIPAGDYSLVIMSQQGCGSPVQNMILQNLPTLPPAESSAVFTPCTGEGYISFNTAGTEYSFDGGSTWGTSPVTTNLTPDLVHMLVYKNAAGCLSEPAPVFIPPLDPVPSMPDVSVTHPGSCGSTGAITILLNSFEYSFDNGITWQTGNTSGPLSPGIYLIKVRNSYYCQSPAATVTINQPAAAPAAPIISITDPTCVLLTGSILVSTAAMLYSYDDGITWTTSNMQTGLAPGSYAVKIKDAAGCESPASVAIIMSMPVPVLPAVTIIQPDCNSATGTIIITGTEFLYSFDNGLTWTENNISPPLADGIYNIKTKNAGGCESPVLAVTIITGNVSPPVVANLNYCQFSQANMLTASGVNLLWYTTSSGGLGSSIAPIPATNSVGTTNYYVSQTLNGCESERSLIAVTTSATPPAPLTNNVTYCQNSITLPLTAVGNNLLWFSTSTGGTGSFAAPIPSSATPGVMVYYVSQATAGCESGRSAITVTIIPQPNAPITTIHQSLTHNIVADPLSAQGSGIKWYDSNYLLLTTAPIPNTSVPGLTSYFVSQTNAGGCESPLVEVVIEVVPNIAMINFPKFFTPNGDGINEYWNVFFSSGIKAEVLIFDRYGKTIKQMTVPGYGWDGTYNGESLPATDYWFKVTYKEYGVHREYRSHFSLVR